MICPGKQDDTCPAIPKSGTEALTPGAGVKDDLALPQSALVLRTTDFIRSKVLEPGAGWTAFFSLEKELAPLK